MEVRVGNKSMRVVSFADDRYVDVVSMDGTISIRLIIEKDNVVVTAKSGTMIVEHQCAHPAVRIEKAK